MGLHQGPGWSFCFCHVDGRLPECDMRRMHVGMIAVEMGLDRFVKRLFRYVRVDQAYLRCWHWHDSF